MSLQAIFGAIQQHDYVLPAAGLRRALGATALAAAERAGLVYHARPATFLVCACGGRRAIVESEDADHPYLAVCEDSADCLDRPLSDFDLEQRGVSVEGATDALAGLLQLERGGMAGDSAPGIVRLGMREHQAVLTECFLLVRTAAVVVEGFSTARGVAPFPTLLLATTTDHLPHDLLGRHGPGQRVEIAPLERFLALEGERIVARITTAPAALSSSAARHVGAAAFCVLMTQEGERTLSRPEYDALIESEAPEFGIFLDAAVLRGKRRGAGGFEVFRRRTTPGGAAASSLLTSSEAAIVTEFLRKARGGFIDVVEQLDALDRMADAERAFRNAWQKFDPERQLLMKRASRNDTFARVRPSTDMPWGVLVPVG